MNTHVKKHTRPILERHFILRALLRECGPQTIQELHTTLTRPGAGHGKYYLGDRQPPFTHQALYCMVRNMADVSLTLELRPTETGTNRNQIVATLRQATTDGV
jgi:hypothetical protein